MIGQWAPDQYYLNFSRMIGSIFTLANQDNSGMEAGSVQLKLMASKEGKVKH
jgi:hypothetical protein